MVKRQKVEAFILSRKNSGEADRIVTFFTREFGIKRAMAKGVRKIPSSRGGHLEPFTQVLTLLSESQAGTYIGAVETKQYFSSLHSDSNALHCAKRIALVITRLFDEGESQAEIYDKFHHALMMLPRLNQSQQQLLEGALLMVILRQAGLMPDLQACQICGNEQPTHSIIMNMEEGGWRCITCHNSFQGTQYSLSPRLLKVLRFMSRYPQKSPRIIATPEETTQLIQAMRWGIAHITGQMSII